jgi:signal transduction histidine kinase
MKFSRLQLSRIFLFITLFILLILTYVTYQRVKNLISYSDLVDHTNNVRIELEQSLSYLKDAETGQRGFIITGDSIYLDPFFESYGKINATLNSLYTMTRDHDLQRNNISKLHQLMEERYALMRQTLIASRNYSPNTRFRQTSLLLKGKIKMDEIRILVRKMIDIELKLLKERESNKNSYANLTPMFIVMFMTFSVSLVIASYFIIVGELKKTIEIRRELEVKIQQLNRSNSELEQFAYVASHDLQEPLRKIQSFGDRLTQKYKSGLDQDGNMMIHRMQNAASRMQLLINDLLEYSRVEHKTENNRERTDLSTTIRNIRGDLQVLIEEKKAIIKTDALPIITAIPPLMQQLFQNLLNNALKFSKTNVTPLIIIKYELVKGSEIKETKPVEANRLFHKISIIDNGIGFEEQYAEKIFIIFQRLHGKMEYSGSGIGLAVCKKIVLAHQGYIEATSIIGDGSAFNVYLPA